MSRTHRRIAPRNEYLAENWYKYQEEKKLGKGPWLKAIIKSRRSSNRMKVRVAAAQNHEGLAERRNKVQ